MNFLEWIVNKSSLVKVTVCRRLGHVTSFEPMMIKIPVTMLRHCVTMSHLAVSLFARNCSVIHLCFLNNLATAAATATYIWVNIGSGNGLLLDGIKPIPEPIFTPHVWGPVSFIWGQFRNKYLIYKSLKLAWKLALQWRHNGHNSVSNH